MPRSEVAAVARPSVAPIAVPKVCAPGPTSPRAPPMKRAEGLENENTSHKMQRLLAPTPKVPTCSSSYRGPPEKPVNRQLSDEFDAAASEKGGAPSEQAALPRMLGPSSAHSVVPSEASEPASANEHQDTSMHYWLPKKL